MQLTTSAKHKWLPKRGHYVHFHDRQKMKAGRPERKFTLPKSVPVPSLPIDWTKGNTLSFPMDGNDQYGDCMYVAACHADGVFTGNVGLESIFDTKTIIKDYLKLAGGDNGLDEGQIVGEWTNNGLAGVADAKILDSLDIDPTDPQLAQTALYYFGGFQFMLDVPDDWVNNFDTGSVWDAPATADQNNGHGVWIAAAQANGNYEILTWGSYCYLTPAGMKVCDPSAFVVFSLRWFDAQGYAPNGLHYTQLAPIWQECGGKALPESPFPLPGDTTTSSPPTTTTVVPTTTTVPPTTTTLLPTTTTTVSPVQPPPINFEQIIQSLADKWLGKLEQDASNDPVLETVLQSVQSYVDTEIQLYVPQVTNQLMVGLEGWLNVTLDRWQQQASTNAFLSPVAVKYLPLLRDRGIKALEKVKQDNQTACQGTIYGSFIRAGVPVAHVLKLKQHALPPGTLVNLLQMVSQYGPQIVQLVLQLITAIKGGG